MITAAMVRLLDMNAAFFGVPTLQLMDNAGRAVAEYIRDKISVAEKTILVFCGTGNNGGDGFVAARYLAAYCPTTVFLLGTEVDIKTADAQHNYQRLREGNIEIYTLDQKQKIPELIDRHTVIVDAMLGIGLSGSLRAPYKETVEQIARADNKVILSVDIATGLGTDLAVQPDYTITFHDSKEGMNQKNSGVITIVDIGIPKQAQTHVGPGQLYTYYSRPKPASHKHDNGVVLIIGGGPYYGAPALSAMAALRTGCDLVHIATPHHTAQSIACFSPNFIIHPLSNTVLTPDDVATLAPLIKLCTALVIGPGLGTADETVEAVTQILQSSNTRNKPTVVDADAIQSLGSILPLHTKDTLVVTPHAGEYKKLTGEKPLKDMDNRTSQIKTWAYKNNLTVLFKGPVDIITDGYRILFNSTHNAAMTVGGTGDVLAGVVGALLSKKMDAFHAACVAAFINGAAGNMTFEYKSYGLIATDIIEFLPILLKKYL